MKAEIRFFEGGYNSAEVPEIRELREEIEAASKDELVEAAKAVELPTSAGFAHIFVAGEPVIGITSDGIRDIEADEWIVED